MSKLNDLITQLCPDGVEYRNLYDVAHFNRGKTITARDAVAGTVPVVAGGQKPAYYHNVSNRPAGTITVAGSGAYSGYVSLWKTPIWLSDAFSVTPNDEHKLSTAFLYQFLKLNQNWIYAKKKGSGVPHVHGADLSRLQVPVPPIEVQHEVVRILDAFTELEAELEAELACRIEQYEYFRYYLLDEKNLERIDGKPVETKKLGDIVDILDSKRKPVKRGSRVSGKYPYYGANGVQDYINDYLFDGEFLLVGEDGSVITDKGTPILNWANGKIWVNNHAHVLQEKEDKRYMLRYIKYALECKNIARLIHGAIPKLNQQTLKSIEIPVPSLATQERIVDILDRFDTLTTSFTDGIPAEIAMRREQYEYFRSRLLDFPRLPEDSNSDGE